jgi:hypothetical protein
MSQYKSSLLMAGFVNRILVMCSFRRRRVTSLNLPNVRFLRKSDTPPYFGKALEMHRVTATQRSQLPFKSHDELTDAVWNCT